MTVPITGYSYDLEVPLQLPVRHPVEPLPPFPFARRGKVVDEIVAEPIARQLGGFEVARRLDQRARGTRHILGADVGAVDRLGGEPEIVLDAVQTGGDARGRGEVGIHVGAGAASLEPRRLRARGDDPEARRAVVETPGRLDRRPE